MKPHKRKIALIILPIIAVCIILPIILTKNSAKASANGKLTVSFIDVSHGDCTFITFPNGKTLMIDCGPKDLEINEKIVSYVKKQGVKELDYLILTGVREEHIAGAINVLEEIKVGKVYIPDVKKEENFAVYSAVLSLIKEKGIETETLTKSLNLNAECVFKVLAPLDFGSPNSPLNDFNVNASPTEQQKKDISPIFYLEYKDKTFVLSSDAGKEQEDKLLNSYSIGLNSEVNLRSVDFLKVGDHGLSSASSSRFIEYLNPDYAIISVGGDNSDEAPSFNTLLTLSSVGAEVIRTDTNGTARVEISKYGYVTVIREFK